MGAMTCAGDVATGLFDLQLERLTLITHRQRSFVTLLVFRKAFPAQIGTGLFFHLPKYSAQLLLSSTSRFQHDRAALFFHHVGSQNAICGECTG